MLAAIPIVLIGILGVIIVPKLLKKTPAFIPQEIPVWHSFKAAAS
jgi:ABC-type phosphate transport system permease subunit